MSKFHHSCQTWVFAPSHLSPSYIKSFLSYTWQDLQAILIECKLSGIDNRKRKI